MKSDGINISIRKVVGVNAGRIRVQRGYSQTFAAERSGIDRSALNKFEVGKFNPSRTVSMFRLSSSSPAWRMHAPASALLSA